MKTPNSSQQRAIESDHPNILCIAGPGSGKTATLCARIERLVREGADPRRMACVTFTNAAAEEMTRRLDPIKPGYIGTLHGLALRILTAQADAAGFQERITVLDEGQAEQLLDSVKREMNYRGTDAQLKAALERGPVFVPDTAELVAMAFKKRLKKSGLVTFDTLLQHASRIARLCIDYDHLFVDEFQDSGASDVEIYREIKARNKFFVGDPDQSIYGFRGGSVEHINSMADDGNVQVIRLESNYRSDMAICEAAQTLIEHNLGRLRKRTVPVSDQTGMATAQELATEADERSYLTVNIMRQDPDVSTAVLVRTNAQVDYWAECLRAYHIPVAVKKAVELPPDWRKAKALLAYLGDPLNDQLCYWWAVASQDTAAADRLRLASAAAGKSMDSSSYNLAGRLVGDTRAAVGEVLGRALSPASCNRIESVRATLASDHTPAELLLAIQQADNQPVEVGEGVTVSTIHGAKGREWDRVYLPGFVDSIIPGTRKDLDIEEERRLAYVAVTRARHGVHVSWSLVSANPWTGQKQATRPSRFVEEMLSEKLIASSCEK